MIPFNQINDQFISSINAELLTAIQFSVKDSRSILADAIHYSVTAGGKRIRPILCMASEYSFFKKTTVSLVIGTAIELLHTYSLIHDDLPAMDNDDYRRGKLSCHKKFGENIAILAGDTLNTYVFEYLCTALPLHTDSTSALNIIRAFATACGVHGMAGGQCLDLNSSHTNNDDASLLTNIHHLKTGKILEACFALPLMADSSLKQYLSNLESIGYHYGMLFQICDDILDATASKEILGKSPGKDAEQKKLTYVTYYGLNDAIKKATDHKKAAVELIHNLPLRADYISPIFNETFAKGVAHC